MKRIYVAGPFSATSIPALMANMRQGFAACLDLIKKGYAPFCPWLDLQYQILSPVKIEDAQAVSMAWMEVSDAVLVLPGWQHSVGTAKEIDRATELKIPVYFSSDRLENDITP